MSNLKFSTCEQCSDDQSCKAMAIALRNIDYVHIKRASTHCWDNDRLSVI